MFISTINNLKYVLIALVLGGLLGSTLLLPSNRAMAQVPVFTNTSSDADLESQIETLLALIASLQDQLEETQSTSSPENGMDGYLRTAPSDIAVEFVDSRQDKLAYTASSSDIGKFKIQFDITAFEDDVYINRDRSSVEYAIVNSARPLAYTDGRKTVVLDSGADVMTNTYGSYYEIKQGDTETFELIVVFEPEDSGFYKLVLSQIGYNFSPYNKIGKSIDVSDLAIETDPISLIVKGTGEVDDDDIPKKGKVAKADLKAFFKIRGGWVDELDKRVPASKRLRVRWDTKNVEDCSLQLEYRKGVEEIELDSLKGRMVIDQVKARPDRGLHTVTLLCDGADTPEGVISDSIDIKYFTAKKEAKFFVDGQLVRERDMAREYAISYCLWLAEKNESAHVMCTFNGKVVYKQGADSDIETASAEAAIEDTEGDLETDDSADQYENGEEAQEDTGEVVEDDYGEVLGISTDPYLQLAGALLALSDVLEVLEVQLISS